MNLRNLCALSLAFVFTSCAAYRTPTRQADMALFTNPDVKQEFEAKPAMRIPANIAVVRVQKPERTFSAGADVNAYQVVTKREVETQKDLDTIAKLPGVEGVVTLSRFLLPAKLCSDLDLRKAAARLHADAILLYTFETNTNAECVYPLVSLATLGLAPNWKYSTDSTVSAILMDTKTGFIYGTIEESESRTGVASGWFLQSTVDAKRKAVERAALEDMLGKFEPFWKRIANQYKR